MSDPTIYIIFADGGWIEFNPIKQKLKRSGTDWNDQFEREPVSPTRIFRAVSVVDDFVGLGKVPATTTIRCY